MSISDYDKRYSVIKVAITHNTRTLCSELRPYLPIAKIREDALIFFGPEVSKLSLYYNNQSLSSYEHWAIGDYFKNKQAITLHFQSSEESYKTIESNRIFPIKARHNCLNPAFNDYCCYCKEYYCSNCSSSLSHSNHLTVHRDTWQKEEEIKAYAKRIQQDIERNIQATKDCYKKYKDDKNYYNILNRREKIMQKLEKVHAIFMKMIKVLQFEMEKPAEVDMYMRNIDQKGKSAIDSIEDTIIKMNIDLNDLNAAHVKLDYYTLPELTSNSLLDKYKSTFDALNYKEKQFYITSNNAQIFRTTYQLNTKMNIIWDQLEKILDGALAYERPLTIEDDPYATYLMLLQHNQNIASIGIVNANSAGNFMYYNKSYHTPLKPLLVVNNNGYNNKHASKTVSMKRKNQPRNDTNSNFLTVNNTQRKSTNSSCFSKGMKPIRIQLDAEKGKEIQPRKRLKMPMHYDDDYDEILEFNKFL